MKKGVVIGVALIFSFVLAAVFVIPSVSAGGGCGGLQDPLTEEGLCADEIDNDCDDGNGIDDEDPNTGIDCNDTDCDSDPACIPTPTIGITPSYPGTGLTDVSGGPGPVKPGPPEPGPDPSPSSEEASGLFGGFFKNLFEKIFGNKDKKGEGEIGRENGEDSKEELTIDADAADEEFGIANETNDTADGYGDLDEKGVKSGSSKGGFFVNLFKKKADDNDDGNVNIGDAIYLTGVEGDGTGEGYEDLYEETLMDINEWTAKEAKKALWANSDGLTVKTAIIYSENAYGSGMAEAFEGLLNGNNACFKIKVGLLDPITGPISAAVKEIEKECDSAVVFGSTNFLKSVVEEIENQGLEYLPIVVAAPVEIDRNGDYSFVDGGDIDGSSGSWIHYSEDPSMFLPALAKAKTKSNRATTQDLKDGSEIYRDGVVLAINDDGNLYIADAADFLKGVGEEGSDDDDIIQEEEGCEEGSVCETPNPECSGTCRGGVCHERCPVDEIQAAVNGEGIDSDLTVYAKGPRTRINDLNGDKIGIVTNMKVKPGGEEIDFTYKSSDGSEEAFYGAEIDVPFVVGNQKITILSANPGNGPFKRDSASFKITEASYFDLSLEEIDEVDKYPSSETTVMLKVGEETRVAGREFTLKKSSGAEIDLGVDGFELPLLEEGKIYEIPVYGAFNNPITLTVDEITNGAVTMTFEVGEHEERILPDLVSNNEFSMLPDSEKIDALLNMIRSLQERLDTLQSRLSGASWYVLNTAGVSPGLTPTSGSGDMQKTANCQAGEYYPIDLDPQSGVIGLLHDDSLGDDYINAEGYCKVVNGCDSYLVGTVNKDGTQSCDCDENGCPATAGCEFTSSTSGYSRIWSSYCYDYAPVGCTDSDINNKYPKGDNYETKGNALDGSNTYEDECVGNTLYEGECAVDWDLASYWAVSVPYDCPNGCFNGACLPTKSPFDQLA